MKKFLVMIMAVVMVFSFTACGKEDEHAEREDGTIKVGAIYIGSANDGCFTQQMDESLRAACEATGATLIAKENVSDSDTQASMDTATNLIDQGCTIIVGCSYGFGDALNELANSGDYDDITFLHFSGGYQNDTNMENFFGSMEQARYLSGMAAASVTKTNVLGYVAAFPYTEVQIGINAFTLGAQSVNPDVEVKVVYINTWGDAEIEKTAAEQLIAANADVLTYHADSTATQVAAKEAGVYCTGWNLCNNAGGDAYITAPYWDFTQYFTDRINQVLAGEFKPTGNVPFSTYGSLADGMINIDALSSAVPEDAAAKIEEVKAQMIAGEFSVFSGEILYADGSTLCAAGQTLTDEEVWKINNVVKGVTATDN